MGNHHDMEPTARRVMLERIAQLHLDLEFTADALERSAKPVVTPASQRLAEAAKQSRKVQGQAEALRNEIHRPSWQSALASLDSINLADLVERIDRLAGDAYRTWRLLDRLKDEAVLPGLDRDPNINVLRRLKEFSYRVMDLHDLVLANAEDPMDLWISLYTFRLEADDLIDECLDIIRSSPNSTIPGDDAASMIARGFCHELADDLWIRDWVLTVGSSELFTPRTRAIKMRYPPPGVWDLPILAHEMAHAAIADLQHHRLREFYETLPTRGQIDYVWLEELAADAIASLAAGPAYGFAVVYRGLNPLESDIGSDTHPPASARVAAIVRALSSLRYPRSEGHIVEELASIWAAITKQAGTRASLDEASSSITVTIPPLVEWVATKFPPWHIADRTESQILYAAEFLARKDDISHPIVFRVVDVLNAAWIARLRVTSEDDVNDLGARAEQLCLGILPAKNASFGRPRSEKFQP